MALETRFMKRVGICHPIIRGAFHAGKKDHTLHAAAGRVIAGVRPLREFVESLVRGAETVLRALGPR